MAGSGVGLCPEEAQARVLMRRGREDQEEVWLEDLPVDTAEAALPPREAKGDPPGEDPPETAGQAAGEETEGEGHI